MSEELTPFFLLGLLEERGNTPFFFFFIVWIIPYLISGVRLEFCLIKKRDSLLFFFEEMVKEVYELRDGELFSTRVSLDAKFEVSLVNGG